MSAKRHGWQWFTASLLGLVALLVWALSQAAFFLESKADPKPSQADILLALGGDDGSRGLTVARLYAAGFAPRVLLSGFGTNPTEVRRTIKDWRVQILAQSGVPPERIELDLESNNSWEEAINVRQVMLRHGWRRVLVVSDPYHMRRLSWTWRRVFEGSGLEYSLLATSPSDWKPDIWWRDEKSGAAVIMEYIKIAYYLVKY